MRVEKSGKPASRTPTNYGSIAAPGDGLTTSNERGGRDVTRLCASLVLVLLGAILVVILHIHASAEPGEENGWSQMTVSLSRPEAATEIPFTSVDRSDYNDPVSKIMNRELFHPSLWGGDNHDFTFPFPTGAFWTNLVLPPTADRGLSYPVAVYPYAYKWSNELLQVSYPASHRKEEPKMIHDYVFPDLTLSAVEETTQRHVQSFDPLSVTLRFNTLEGYWETYLVQGSPYITIQYHGTTPTLHAFSIFRDIVCPDEGSLQFDNGGRLGYTPCTTSQTAEMSKSLFGVQFMLQSNEGMNWLVLSSEPIELVYDEITKTTVTSKQPFHGVLRIAILPSSLETNVSSSGLQRLLYHAKVYPVSGKVSWSFQTTSEAKRVGTIRFDYETKSFGSSADKELLMMALPHHAQSLPKSQLVKDFDLVYKVIKGNMTAVLGSTWAYEEVLPTNLGFDGDMGSNSMESLSDPTVRSLIMENLQHDMILALPTLTENVYGFGKQAARLAQMAHVAKMLHRHCNDNDIDKENLEDLLNRLLGLLSDSLEHFLTSNVADSLVYDSNLGGLVSLDGLMNTQADFGNGRYNDHHFQFGYLLYACAVMGNLNETFVRKFKSHVDAVYFDIAHGKNLDSHHVDNSVFFPGARHKVWFDGHSFASGLFPFGNGKSQESSSEAVNGYYGAYLWSLVRHGFGADPGDDTCEQTDFARLLLATEIRGARMYWHMATPESLHGNETLPTIYPAAFSENLMVGNLGMLDAICSTWFGTETLYVHMINFVPVTSVTGELFSRPFVSEEVTHSLRPVQDIEMAWRGYVVADSAIVDPMRAWQDAQELFSPELDAGLSKSQVLYWIATRDGFDAAKISPPDGDSSSDSESRPDSTVGSSCRVNKACADAGLGGECCPTTNGNFLQCCTVAPSKSLANSGGGGSCQANQACADAGLTGDCCPTVDGNFLDCCISSSGES